MDTALVLEIQRLYTQNGIDPLDGIEFAKFKVTDFAGTGPEVIVTAPEPWSQTAVEILYNKYMRKAGVPFEIERASIWWEIADESLQPSRAKEGTRYGGETDARQVFGRLAGHWAFAALTSGLLNEANAAILRDEMTRMLALQVFAPNSPQWFNTGLWWAYGLEGDTVNWVSTPSGEPAKRLGNREAYRFPQTSACFINSVADSLIGDGGILDLLKTEAQIFKYGSGSGANFSGIRGKGAPLSGGGKSSGLMSFLKVFDANAGAIKSGGTTRRAAKMVVVDADHPEATDFVDWKSREETKVLAMSVGARKLAMWDADDGVYADDADLLASLTTEWESEAYITVGGQNSNNSLRVSDDFMSKVENDGDGPEAGLFAKLCRATWRSGDPGLQFDGACNRWHTVPKAGRQRATNPCSEFSFIDDSACNLASLNLIKFLDENGQFMCSEFSRAIELVVMVLDLTVDMSSYPTAKIAENSVKYRPIGLGYTNLGGMLMAMGVPYASPYGCDIAGAITDLMQASAWRASEWLANYVGPFGSPGEPFEEHAEDVSRVFNRHLAAHNRGSLDTSAPINTAMYIWTAANTVWNTCTGGPVRNAQLTLLAPTGTIGLVMDCATTGIEPEYSLVRHKKLAGGGSMDLVNPLVGIALRRLGYNEAKIHSVLAHVDHKGRVPADLEHASVFECANDMDWGDHLNMMAAVQPFLSGAISKTVNMPNDATVDDIAQCYITAWNLGLKAVAPYRDGSKFAQPLTSKGPTKGPATTAPVSTLTNGQRALVREKLPNVREAKTHKTTIGGHSVYLHVGMYPDRRIGEMFLDIGGEGSTMALFMNALARSVSIGLQYGIPLSVFVEAFMHASGEPSGVVQGSDNVRFCSSIVDYLARELQACYCEVPGPSVSGEVLDLSGAEASTGGSRFAPGACLSCGKRTLVRNGTCLVCATCGETTGCS